jgi:beta-N-acetylhexosaminidase
MMLVMPTLREKIAQMFLVGVGGPELTGEERIVIERYGFGGFILFGHNCCVPAQILSLCRALWETGHTHPPFIAIDQEGGRVHRLPKPFTHFPPAARIGATDNPNFAYEAARATAEELAAVGINLDFAPVLDFNSNPKSVIGDRSFAADPQSDRLQRALIRLRDGGIIPAASTFPVTAIRTGLSSGPTGGESSLEEIDKVGYPLRQRLSESNRILDDRPRCLPGLDPDLPATLSSYRNRIAAGQIALQRPCSGTTWHESDQRPLWEEEAIALCPSGIDVMLFCLTTESPSCL